MIWKRLAASGVAQILRTLPLVISAAYLGFLLRQRASQCNRCEMAFMGTRLYEVVNEHYGLILYDELHNGKVNPACIPVLFIPGNGGSAKQMRSLASQSQSHQDGFCLSWYGVRLNEELTALNSQLVYAQAAHVGKMASLLRQRHSLAPELWLVGHSMGGIVGSLANLGEWPRVSMLALASPLRNPVLPFDYFAEALQTNRSGFPIYAVGGGQADIQVPLEDQLHDTIATPRLLGAWSDPDHQAIVWSHAVVRSLIDLLHAMIQHPSEEARRTLFTRYQSR